MDTAAPQRLDEEGFPVKEAHPNVFEIYNREGKIYDSAMVERWRTAMEGLLIFAGLFSAAVTAFIIESYKTLQPDPNDQMVVLLAQISRQLAGDQTPNPPDEPFSPLWTAIATNILWFISLGLSLACAVAATLVQQWARNYVHAIERRPSVERRAHMRMYLFEGVERFGMSRIIDGIPALIHIALFTFLLGLVFFIKTVSVPVTVISVLIFVMSTVVYLFTTLVPFVAYDCPYQTPLTSILWQKSFIRLFYWICGHTVVIAKDLSSLVSTPVNATVAVAQGTYSTVMGLADAVWTFADLTARTFFARLIQALVGHFRDESPLGALHSVSMYSTELTTSRGWVQEPGYFRDESASDSMYSTRRPEDRKAVLKSWSPERVEATFDATRVDVVRRDQTVESGERENKAFVWLAQCLDEHRELLPFLEAVPSFTRRKISHRGEPSTDPLSAILSDPSLGFYERAQGLYSRYPGSNRVWSAYLQFCLTIPNPTLISLFQSDPDRLYYPLYEFPPPPDNASAVIKIRWHGLRAIFTTCWTMSPPGRIPVETPGYFVFDELERLYSLILDNDGRFPIPTASQRLISRCFTGKGITRVNRLDDPVLWQAQIGYFALVRFYLDVSPELAKLTEQEVWSLHYMFIALHLQFELCHSNNLKTSKLAQESEHLLCAVVQFMVTALESCSESITYHHLQDFLPLLVKVRHRSAMEIVHEILELPFWFTKLRPYDLIYRDIVTTLERFQDDLGPFYISHSVRQKSGVIELFEVPVVVVGADEPIILPPTEMVASLDLRGADIGLQQYFIQRATTYLPSTNKPVAVVPWIGLDAIVLFAEAVMDVFYTLTDLECLREALYFMDQFLSPRNYPYHQLGIECREYLRATILEKGWQEASVQVDEDDIEVSPWSEVAIQTQ